MTGEEMERAVEFLFKSQADLTETVGKPPSKVDRNPDSIAALLAIAEINEREIRANDEKLNALITVVERLAGSRGTK
ncbi:MAG: hypothetical protein M3268_10490 [Acidobacteriota bacterium]|nr:hypothetical protein [Acidobacteriota bacterium]